MIKYKLITYSNFTDFINGKTYNIKQGTICRNYDNGYIDSDGGIMCKLQGRKGDIVFNKSELQRMD